MDTQFKKAIKKQLTLVAILLFVGHGISAQTASEILTNELAFTTHLFCRIDFVPTDDGSGKTKFQRVPQATVNGFVYLNIPDSLVVIHCNMADLGVNLSERFIVRKVLEHDPIVLSAWDESAKDVILQVVPEGGTYIQVYYPDEKIDVGYGEHMMAYEFLEFEPLGRTRKFVK